MKTYGIKVPFPEVMSQGMYDELKYERDFWNNFDIEEYVRKCDIVDNKINKLLLGSKEEFIGYDEIPEYLNINYLKDKIKLLEEFMPVKFICEKDDINHRFKIILLK